jgi:(4S)-4-hydroxy-5-phosphonooxypentane-2,3-dione isomerase
MIILLVQMQVVPEQVDTFREITAENARNSIQEPGVIRFDFVQQIDDPTRFMLVEVYRDEAAIDAHRQSVHYAKWRQAADPLMAEPRSRTMFKPVFPLDQDW